MVEIRRANSSDHDGLVDLWVETGLGRLSEEEWDVLIAHPAAAVLIADDGGNMVGAAIASFDGWRAYVYHVAVVPGRRRRGVAKALFDEAQAHLAREGNRIVYVMVNEENEGGMALLHSLGYRQQGDIVMVNEIGDGSDVD